MRWLMWIAILLVLPACESGQWVPSESRSPEQVASIQLGAEFWTKSCEDTAAKIEAAGIHPSVNAEYRPGRDYTIQEAALVACMKHHGFVWSR